MFGKLNVSNAIKAGFWGTVVMTIMMYGLPPLMGLPPMDIMAALGSVFPFGISPYIFGFVAHFGIGISLGLIYAAFFFGWLPGPRWLKGAMFSFLPWIFAITLLGPSLQMASRIFGTASSAGANPCAVSNPCAARVKNPCAPVNPCATKGPANPCGAQVANPCAAKSANPCAAQNPCAAKESAPNPCAARPANPCAANPCAAGAASQGGIPPEVLSLMGHLVFGGVLGAFYRPRA
jgi:hypothetical protein